MAKFITHPEGEVKIGKYDFKNNAINIELVTKTEKTREHYYPDNEGVPTLTFHFIGGTKEQWLFRSEKLRDEMWHFVNL
jgi:hypothetical protein